MKKTDSNIIKKIINAIKPITSANSENYKAKKVVNAEIRRTIINMISDANAAHAGSALSMVEILNAIFLSVSLNKIKKMTRDRDRVVLSKGHGASGLYAVMFHHGLLSKDAIESYFKNGSIMAGHVSHFIDTVEHSTGSLGHGLPVGLGMAIGSLSKGYDNRIFVVVGDGELNEGSNWEAIMYAGHLKLTNLCLMIDKNKFSQMDKVADACSLDPLYDKFIAFNFNVIEIGDGHDETQLINAIQETKNSLKPVAIICNTIKGKGVSFMEGENIWHYRTPTGKDFQKALEELDGVIK
jgi:transketolase|tara:strand:- start:5251 stop:6138 length:888 start_codon:yes stop_codon:yes gene_type:complete